VIVIGMLKATPWHPFGAAWARSSTPGTEIVTPFVEFAGIGSLTVVGALASRLMLAFAHAVGLVDVGVPQLTLVIVTANGLGFVTLT
jgi:hypothetical protein